MKFHSVLTAALFFLLSLFAAAQSPNFQSFSADMKTTGHQGQDMTGKFYFSAQEHKTRMDMNSHGQNMSVIADASNETNPKSTMLMHERKMYMETSALSAGPGMRQRSPQVHAYNPENPCANLEGTTCKKVGTETVNGYACDKWEMTGKDNQTVWISKDLHFPIKTVHSDGTSVEFSNIKPGPQDAALFQVPAGYQKFDMGGMMGGHMPQQ